jgi:4'-phosphopantetheinyl transferase
VLTAALGGALEDCARWQIIAADDGAPEVFLDGSVAPVAVSISHRAGWAAAVLSKNGKPIGIDLELLEPRSERFVRDFFTDREVAAYLEATVEVRDAYAATVWSAKESILKCLRAGLRRDTRSVEVAVRGEALRRPRPETWAWVPGADLQTGERFDVWWMARDDLLVTIAAPALRLAA